MTLCIECGSSVPHLYTEYSHNSICLTKCEKCDKFADKYVEFDHVIIFIDMLLHKPQVYRHLLFNFLLTDSRADGIGRKQVPWSVIKLCILSVLFDVYIKWSRIEKNCVGSYLVQSFAPQYFYLVAVCSFGNHAMQHMLECARVAADPARGLALKQACSGS